MLRILAILLLISFTANAQVPAQKIPDFELYRFNNAIFTNSDLEKGKKIFFLFFDSDCEHCHRALEYINKNYKLFAKASIYLVSLDEPKRMLQTIDRYAHRLKGLRNVMLLQDKRNEFIGKFKPRKYPSMFLYSSDSILIDYEDNEETIFRILKYIKG